MGLAFKPDIDDLRESPALFITRRLIAEGMNILAVEPNIESFKEFNIVNHEDAANEADIILFLVSHKEFKHLNCNGKEIIDSCGVLKS
jgi:UDP-N-acetyl-D-mannosaminuronic acid dehydrogenase